MMKIRPIYVAIISALLLSANSTFVLAANTYSTGSQIDEVQVDDPYGSAADSPWTARMSQVTMPDGRVLMGSASQFGSAAKDTFDTFTPYARGESNLVAGYGSSTVGFGCDGINLGGVVDGQLAMYQQLIEQFMSRAPTMAVMFLAYSQPVVKAVLDELNGVSQFGLDMSNMTCSGVRAMADKSLEDKKQSMAEAQCTSEAGFKDPDCMSGEGINGSLATIMRDAKTTVNSRAGQLMSGVTSASGGLVKFRGSVGGTTGSSSTGPSSPTGSFSGGISSRRCTSIDVKGVLGLILGSSEMSCYDIKNYAGLLPNYESDDDVQGVIPRKITLLDVSKKMSTQYYVWIMDAIAAPADRFNQSEGFKALVNRIGTVITDEEHRRLSRLSKDQPAEYIAMVRNMATIAAVKDMTGIVNRLDVGVMTGIQNQPNSEFPSDRQINQYKLALSTLRSELKSISDQIELDKSRASLTAAGQ
jgi:hypothetical protein